MHGPISSIEACNPCGNTMKMSSMYHRLLICDVNGTTKIDGMGLFKNSVNIIHMYQLNKSHFPIMRYRDPPLEKC